MAWHVYVEHMATPHGQGDLAEARSLEATGERVQDVVGVESVATAGFRFVKRLRILSEAEYTKSLGKRTLRHPLVHTISVPDEKTGDITEHFAFNEDPLPGRVVEIFSGSSHDKVSTRLRAEDQLFTQHADQLWSGCVDTEVRDPISLVVDPSVKLLSLAEARAKTFGDANDVRDVLPQPTASTPRRLCRAASLGPLLSASQTVTPLAVRRSASALSVGDVEENSDAAAIVIGSGGEAVGLVEAQGATLEASSGVMQLDDAALGGLAGEDAKDDDEDEDPGSYNTAFEKWSQVHSLQKVLLRCKLNIRMIQFAEEALKVMTKTDQSALRKQLEQVEMEWLLFSTYV
jgi:hypothetical protein